ERFKGLFDQEVGRHLCAEDCQSVIVSDGELTHAELNLDFANLLRKSGPWGQGFPEPVFDGVFTLVKRRIVAEKHLKLVLRQGSRPEEYEAIAFNITDVTWPSDVQRVQVAYQLDINHFRGATQLQLMVRYIDPTE
ncbi:MAG: single-stranded-DNA-specific exonuclease RecJ, partial [Thiohalomonadales bacterium]